MTDKLVDLTSAGSWPWLAAMAVGIWLICGQEACGYFCLGAGSVGFLARAFR